MSNDQPKHKRSSRSLARKLSAELAWRKCLRNCLTTLILLCAVTAGWCLWNEMAAGGGIDKSVNRRFSGEVDFFPDGELQEFAVNLVQDAKLVIVSISREEKPSFSETAVFRNIRYCFEVPRPVELPDPTGEHIVTEMQLVPYSVEATALLNVEWWLLLLLTAVNLLSAVIRSLVGSGVISKYLRPIDEVAAMAEQLSAQTADRHTVSAEEVMARQKENRQSITGDVQSLAVAIDRIDDSGTRIEVHDTELGGLEAALNNMLKRLDESKRSQIRFVDDASHELRTPIAVIQGYVNMLDRWGKDDPKVRDEAIAAIKSESEHMRTLIDQLLFLARGEMDRHVLTMEQVNLYECLDEILEESVMLDANHRYLLASPEESGETSAPENAEENGAEQSESPDGGLPDLCVMADEAMLKQAIRILRDNAAKYTPEGGEITFRAAGQNGEVTVEVQDTGIGIPAEEIPRIFDRFYRGSNARADNAGGSGLGLSIAKWIVDQHGGRIEAVSVPELGTKMKIILKK